MQTVPHGIQLSHGYCLVSHPFVNLFQHYLFDYNCCTLSSLLNHCNILPVPSLINEINKSSDMSSLSYESHDFTILQTLFLMLFYKPK